MADENTAVSCLKTYDKYQEVVGRHHKIHAEECEQRQLVELPATHLDKVAVGPAYRLYHHDQRANIEDILDSHKDG